LFGELVDQQIWQLGDVYGNTPGFVERRVFTSAGK